LISWITGKIIDSWLNGNKHFLVINCNNLGYEIQVCKSALFDKNKSNLIQLWCHLIKKEDKDLFFGFKHRNQRDFFRHLIAINGVGPQIAIMIIDKIHINEIYFAVKDDNNKLLIAIPGIGKRMAEKIILELKNKIDVFKNLLEDDLMMNSKKEISNNQNLINDLSLTLKSLEYSKAEINTVLDKIRDQNFTKSYTLSPIEEEDIYESLLKEALNLLNKNN
tara:strand:- start:6675 stop:7337 length:663 start_codon:yes stop_codon:yes gene_type:complete